MNIIQCIRSLDIMYFDKSLLYSSTTFCASGTFSIKSTLYMIHTGIYYIYIYIYINYKDVIIIKINTIFI